VIFWDHGPLPAGDSQRMLNSASVALRESVMTSTEQKALKSKACADDSVAAIEALESLNTHGPDVCRELLPEVSRNAIRPEVRARALELLAEVPNNAQTKDVLDRVLNDERDEFVRVTAIRLLAAIEPQQATDHAIQLLDPDMNTTPQGRAGVAETLFEQLKNSKAVSLNEMQLTRLYETLVWEGDWFISYKLSRALSCWGEPSAKLRILLNVLVDSPGTTRGMWDERGAAESLGSTNDRQRLEVARMLIDEARTQHSDHRIVELCAGLILGIGRSQGQAAQLIDQVAQDGNIHEKELRPLRVELGGEAAMRPILDQLEAAIGKQLKPLRQKTLEDWNKATKAANSGFTARLVTVGLAITVAAAWQALSGDKGAALIGPGASLAAGLGSMFAVIYSGPINNIRESVSNLTQASVGFITFMHRLEFTTSFASAEIANGRMNPDSLKQTCDSLERAADDAIADTLVDQASARGRHTRKKVA
jgi:hypothetical protein